MNTDTQFCTFSVDGLHFGVPVLAVQEVIRYQDLTPVPLSSSVVRGLMNLRGQIVTAIDLRARLGLPERTGEHAPMNVVVRTGDGVVSLLVDEIGDVLDVDPAAHERPPETLTGVTRDLICGVFKLDGRLLLELDTEKAINPGGLPA